MSGLEVVGIIANIVQVAQGTLMVLERYGEFKEKMNTTPKTFRSISVQLPVLVRALERTSDAINAGTVPEDTSSSLRPLVKECSNQVKALDELIKKALPKDNDSGVVRGYKAVASFRYEGELQKMEGVLHKYIQTLTFERVVSSNTHNLPAPTPLIPEMICPFRQDPDFVERAVLSEVVSRNRSSEARLALCGLGGLGKSQIALEYGYRVRKLCPETWVFWINTESVETFEKDYRDIARALRIPGSTEMDANVFQMVYEHLCKESTGNWLMIIDNADALDVFTAPIPHHHKSSSSGTGTQAPQILKFLPHSPKGSILITTRDREVAARLTGNYKHVLPVEPMTKAEAVQLLKAKLQGTYRHDEMETLVEALDCVPLAVSQAAAMISKASPRLTISSYLQSLADGDETRASLLDDSLTESHRDRDSNSIVTTWHLSFKYVSTVKPSAARLLSLMCFFNRQGIPEALLTGQYGEEVIKPRRKLWKRHLHLHRSNGRKPNGQPASTTSTFEEDWTILTDFSLIKTNADGHHFSMHAIVQFTTKKWLALHNELDLWAYRYISLINSHFPDPTHHLKDCEQLVAHAYAAIPYRPPEAAKDSLKAWAGLLTKIASYTEQHAFLEMAQKMYQSASDALKMTLGADAPESLACSTRNGQLLSLMGRYKEAEAVHRQVLDAGRRKLGPEHLDILSTMDDLGNVLKFQGRETEAESFHVRALEIRLRLLGPSHKLTEKALEDRGFFLMSQSRYEEAYVAFRQAHEGRTLDTEKKHDSSWTTWLDILGLRLLLKGQPAKAARYFREAVELKVEALGTKHWDTASSMKNLARCLADQENYVEAEAMFRQGYNTNNEMVGPEHVSTLETMLYLARVLLAQGKLEEAEELSRRYLELQEKISGPMHPLTFEGANTLAEVLERRGSRDDALSLYRRAYSGAKETLGEQHCDVERYEGNCRKLERDMAAPLDLPDLPLNSRNCEHQGRVEKLFPVNGPTFP